MDTTVQLTSDHQFALLTARAGLEPDLAQRYTSDPVSVLTEFGLPAMEPVYGDDFAELFGEVYKNSADGRGLVIDYLDRPSGITLYGCATGMAPLPGESQRELVIDNLDRPSAITLYGCATGMAPLPGEEAAAARA
ncbi:hypothetical protein ACWGDS_33640 [Streptomyces sp. NPDC055059]|jgi:hypothetical protein|uniref:Uncharacterized protein n=1 Tax=Streptomyces sp. NBC_00119 TaxID=2975659 RepID=A0AAU1U459_9ACTN|nr:MULTISPECIES: hypothetical protein [unclassified Streptomyces]MCX4642695.1 hypothetical protein [Streptomyces sp. NBC_01446]MCX5327636.1 hypothetical protein [Streptomyces sp. NBC_00120]